MSLRTGDETLRLMLDILHEHQRIKLCIYKITERINLGINCYHHLITIYPFTCKVCSFCRHFLHLTVKYLRNPPFKVNQVSAAAEGFLLMMGIILLLLFLSIFHLKNIFMTLWTNKMSISSSLIQLNTPIMACTQILVHIWGPQNKDFGAVSQMNLTRNLVPSVPQAKEDKM